MGPRPSSRRGWVVIRPRRARNAGPRQAVGEKVGDDTYATARPYLDA